MGTEPKKQLCWIESSHGMEPTPIRPELIAFTHITHCSNMNNSRPYGRRLLGSRVLATKSHDRDDSDCIIPQLLNAFFSTCFFYYVARGARGTSCMDLVLYAWGLQTVREASRSAGYC
jgi:hypothetical protein